MSTSRPVEKNDEQDVWAARIAALTPILGRPSDTVFHAVVPFYLGGFADVIEFPNYVPGMTYVTADLTGEDVGQLPNSLGNYELMICVHENLSRAADLISKLARYTCDSKLEPGDTMDLGDHFSGSAIKALLFTHPSDQLVQFDLLGQRCGLLLCIGITGEELSLKQTDGSASLLALLMEHGIFPYTVLQRESVTG